MTLDSNVANPEQLAAWDGHEGDQWTEHADRYERSGWRQWERFVDAGLIGAHDSVLDIGCGTGRPTRDAARLATSGSVLGIDLSARMLQRARECSEAEGLTNVAFVQGDAQVFAFEPDSCDVAMSSFGVMFFCDPVAAFSNIGRALRRDGRLALLAWRELERNEWLMALREALAVGRDLPVPPPNAPTPFALADPDRVRGLLGDAGYEAVDFRPIDEPVELGRDTADAYAFVETMGIVEGLTQGLDDGTRQRAMSQVREMLAAHETADGVLLGSAAWLITARRS
jgi:SAM-dependent methyltransferase